MADQINSPPSEDPTIEPPTESEVNTTSEEAIEARTDSGVRAKPEATIEPLTESEVNTTSEEAIEVPLYGGGPPPSTERTRLSDAHQCYMRSRRETIPSPVDEEAASAVFEWCSKNDAIIIGSMALDIHCRVKYNVPFHSPGKGRDIDVKIRAEDAQSMFLRLDELVGKHPSMLSDGPTVGAKSPEVGEKVYKYLEVTGMEASHPKVRVGARVLIECAMVASDIFDTIPFELLPVEATVGKKVKVRVMRLDCLISSYFNMIARHRQVNTAPRTEKNVSYLWKLAKIMGKNLPQVEMKSQAQSGKKSATSSDGVASESGDLPLLQDCYYAGATAFYHLFPIKSPQGEKATEVSAMPGVRAKPEAATEVSAMPGVRAKPEAAIEARTESGVRAKPEAAIEVICFGNSSDILHQYLDRYDYSSYEAYYGWEWENVPPAFILSPSQTSKYPPLCLYDGSTVCGNVLPSDKSGKETDLSPIGIAGLTPRLPELSGSHYSGPMTRGNASETDSIPMSVLSLITGSEIVGTMEMGAKPVGDCISSSYILSIGTKCNLSRADYVSNRQYFHAALAATFPSRH